EDRHTTMVPSAWTAPVALILHHGLLVRQRRRVRTLAGAIVAVGVVQFFIGQEVFVTEIIVAVVVAVIAALLHRDQVRERLPYAARVTGLSAAGLALLLAYPIGLQLLGPGRPASSIPDPFTYVTDLANLVVPSSVHF